jgi:hypothetical protein
MLAALHASCVLAVDDAPQVPCAGVEPIPAYAIAPATPAVRMWSDLDWHPPACLAWSAGTYRVVVAIAADIPARDVDDVLARLGAISTTRGLRYWSVTEQAWRVLIEEATALTQPGDGATRADFSAQEMKAGGALYFREKDNRSSRAVTYRMRVLDADATHVVVDSANVDPIRSFGVTLFPPESLHTAYLLQRGGDATWRLYLLSAATGEASRLVTIGRDSYINRAMAAYRHLAGQS